MEVENINKKLISGFLTLSFRKLALLAISFLTINIILARILPIEVIGTFNIANSIVAIFAFFAEVGLGAALIQKKQVSEDDLKTTFTIQTILTTLIAVIVFILAPLAANIRGMDFAGIWLIRALAIVFALNSLKSVPSLLLERELKFKPLVTVELVETIVFNAILVYLSFNHYGVWSFTYAAIARVIVGVATIYLIAPWKISLGISKPAAKVLFGFGIIFQLNSILALLKDRLVSLVVAYLIGARGVSFNTWAQNLAFLPLEVMNIMIRITFPAFARLQDNQAALKQTLERSLFLTGAILYPILFGLLSIAPSLIKYVVSSKWEPALPLIYLFAITAFWATFSTPFTNFLNAIGKIKVTLKLMVMWTILEWSLTPILTYKFNYYGPALSSSLISFSSIATVILVKRNIDIEIIKNIWRPLVSALIMGVITYILSSMWVNNVYTLIVVIIMGGLIYSGLMSLLAWEQIKTSIKTLK